MTIYLITKRDIIRSVPKRFRAQYPALGNAAAWWSKKNRSQREMVSALEKLDTEVCTADDVFAAIETDWTRNECHICREDFDQLVHLGDEPDYDARWVDVCENCLKTASDLFLGLSQKTD